MYLLGDLDSAQFMVLDLANPTEPRAIDDLPPGEFPTRIAWGDENTLYFNVLRRSERDDSPLWAFDPALLRADVESGAVTSFPANGVAFPNSTGRLIAVVDPGVYEESPSVFVALNADGELLADHEQPAISSASHNGWVTPIHWRTEVFASYALAHPDAAYTELGTEPPPTQLFDAFIAGDLPGFLGEIITPFPTRVIWSPDGTQVAYLSPPDENSLSDVMMLTLDDEPTVLMEDLPYGATLQNWQNELAVYHPERGLILWTPEDIAEVEGVLGVTAHPSGGWVLQKTDDTITLYLDGEEQVIASDVQAFDVTLAGR